MRKILLLAVSVICGMSAFAENTAEGVVQHQHSSLVCYSLCDTETPTKESGEYLKAKLQLVIPETIDGKHSKVLERYLISRVFGYAEPLSWQEAIERYNSTSQDEDAYRLCKRVDADRRGMNVFEKAEMMDSVVRRGSLCTFKLDSYRYSGGLQGDSSTEYVNYDCKADKIVVLADLLTDKAKAIKIFQKAVDEGAENSRNISFNDVPKNFYTDRENVILVFNPYEMCGCFTDGHNEVKVSKNSLKPILTPYGKQLLLQ